MWWKVGGRVEEREGGGVCVCGGGGGVGGSDDGGGSDLICHIPYKQRKADNYLLSLYSQKTCIQQNQPLPINLSKQAYVARPTPGCVTGFVTL